MTYSAAFLIKRSVIGDYWQVRVRDLLTGSEDTVDRVHELAEAQSLYDDMSLSMQPMCERPLSSANRGQDPQIVPDRQ